MKANLLNKRMQGIAGSFGLLFLLPTPDEYEKKGNFSTAEELKSNNPGKPQFRNKQNPGESGEGLNRMNKK